MTEKDKLKTLLLDRKRRLMSWNLYKIKDKSWKKINFIPNEYQKDLLDNLFYNNIILKARQLWFSTMIQILMLDQALFYPHVACWIIAQDRDTAENIFDNKVKFAYDELPKRIKDERKIIERNTSTLKFNNGSYIYVSTSFRWLTLNFCHISEYWKICAKTPKKATEINTWALQSVWLWNYVFIESTAEWEEWDFYDKCQTAMKLKLEKKKLNELEYKFHFYPRRKAKEYRINDPSMTLSQETIDYFSTLKVEYHVVCDKEQMMRYQAKKDNLKEKMLREFPSTPQEAFMVAIEWSYYWKRIEKLYEDQKVCSVPYEKALDVHTVRDLWGAGWWDSMVVWFFQIFWMEVRIIDYWDWVWYWIKDVHSEVLVQKPYRYWKMFLPHDARVASMNDRQTREETLRELWYDVIVLDRTAINDRIEITRNSFQNFRFDKSKTEAGIKKVKLYRRKWNESNWKFMDIPEHADSHSADALWYLSQAVKLVNSRTEIKTTTVNYDDELC